jgi:hypothetical protein
MLLDGTVDIGAHMQAVANLIRCAARLGVQRVAKDVTPGFGALLAADFQEQQQIKAGKVQRRNQAGNGSAP